MRARTHACTYMYPSINPSIHPPIQKCTYMHAHTGTQIYNIQRKAHNTSTRTYDITSGMSEQIEVHDALQPPFEVPPHNNGPVPTTGHKNERLKCQRDSAKQRRSQLVCLSDGIG